MQQEVVHVAAQQKLLFIAVMAIGHELYRPSPLRQLLAQCHSETKLKGGSDLPRTQSLLIHLNLEQLEWNLQECSRQVRVNRFACEHFLVFPELNPLSYYTLDSSAF